MKSSWVNLLSTHAAKPYSVPHRRLAPFVQFGNSDSNSSSVSNEAGSPAIFSAFADRRDGLLDALPVRAAPGFNNDDLGMVPAFNMPCRGNRLHGKGFGMMQNLVDP